VNGVSPSSPIPCQTSTLLSDEEYRHLLSTGISLGNFNMIVDEDRIIEHPVTICSLDDRLDRLIVIGENFREEDEKHPDDRVDMATLSQPAWMNTVLGLKPSEDEVFLIKREIMSSGKYKATFIDRQKGIYQHLLPINDYSFSNGLLWKASKRSSKGIILCTSLNNLQVGLSIFQDEGDKVTATPPMLINGLLLRSGFNLTNSQMMHIVKGHLLLVTNEYTVKTVDLSTVRTDKAGLVQEITMGSMDLSRVVELSWCEPNLYVLTDQAVILIRQNMRRKRLDTAITVEQSIVDNHSSEDSTRAMAISASSRHVYLGSSSLISMYTALTLSFVCSIEYEDYMSPTSTENTIMRLLPLAVRRRELLGVLTCTNDIYLLCAVRAQGGIAMHKLAYLNGVPHGSGNRWFDCRYDQRRQQILIAGEMNILHTVDIKFKDES